MRVVRLGLRANLAQFLFLVAVSALVGGTVGQERAIVPLLARQTFGVRASDAEGPWRMASIHREVAANDPHRGMSSVAAGEPTDRNVELVVSSPYATS
jgi:hypothetical protein